MRVELMPDTTNVVRFPIERRMRPTLELLREIAPDRYAVPLIAQAFDLDAPPPDLRSRVDAETAEYLLNHFADTGDIRHRALDALLEPVVARAVEACRAAHNLAVDAAEARDAVHYAQTAGHFWMVPLMERAETLARKAAELLIEAHARVEQTEGVARAVGMARRGETWTPRDRSAETGTLLGMAGKAR
jgi:hypothetical protein